MSIFDIPLQLPEDGFRFHDRPLADGLRASVACECASCAIIQYLNPSDERFSDVVSPGVATMGHALHQMWAWQAFRDEDYQIEAAVPWAHGVSHDDIIVRSGKWVGLYEVKTHSDKQPKAPSAANYRQAEFRLRLRERAGLEVPGPMRLVMIGKAGRESGMVRGPWEVTLTNERRGDIDARLLVIDELLARVESLDLHGPELRAASGGCTRCFPKPKVVASGGVGGLLNRYVRLKREHDDFDGQRKTYAEAKKDLKRELDELRAQIDERVPDGVVVESMGATATRTRSGALVIRDTSGTAEAA